MTELPPSMSNVAGIVLAAGQGTRLRSDTAKVLHRVAGRTLLRHVLEAMRPLGLGQIVVVVGHQAGAVRAEVAASELDHAVTVHQAEQRGTGHAVQQAMAALDPTVARVLVVPGDTPLLDTATLAALVASSDDETPAALLTARFADPTGYGRIVRTDAGAVGRIVEERDATHAERAIAEGNAGMYVVDRGLLASALDGLDDANVQGELYLTDIVPAIGDGGHRIAAVEVDEAVVAGVNDRRQLATAGAMLRARHLEHLMVEVGVTVIDPASTFVDVDTDIGRDTTLLPGTILESGTRVGQRATVGPNTHLTGCTVGDDATVHSTRGTDAEIGDGVTVGPFTHLRAGTRLASGAKAGAFVETKNVTVGVDSKIAHLAYMGDATVGDGVNIACGVVTVNFDGRAKHHTVVGDGAFVGCDTMLVAPVTIGARAYTAAGSVITDDVPDGALGIARARQTVKDGWADRRDGR